MFYTIGLLLLFSVILIFFGRKDRYCYLFVLMAFGAMVAFFSIILHINMFGSYYYYNNSILYLLDYRIFKVITKNISIPISMNIRLMNIGITLYLLAMPIFNMEFCKSVFYLKPKFSNRIVNVFLFTVPLFSMIFYDYRTSTMIYLRYHTSGNQILFYYCISAVNILNKVLILFALLRPIQVLFIYVKKMTIKYLKKRVFLFALGLLLFNVIFYLFFFFSPFSFSIDKVFRSGFWIFENLQIKAYSMYFVAPLVAILIISVCMVILLSFRLGISITPLLARKISSNLMLFNQIAGEILHSQKNALFAIKIMADKIDKKVGNNEGTEEVNRLKDYVELLLTDTTKMLNSIREIKYHYIEESIEKIVEEAITEIALPENIKLNYVKDMYAGKRFWGMYDKYHLSNAFVNVLNNAVEAIERAGRTDGQIDVGISHFFSWIVVAISDNGTGMKRSEKRKIFSPHYSSKTGTFNWGLGLSYTFRVVMAHMGQIKILSKYGKYTTVLIMLPLKKGDKNGKNQGSHCR